VGRRCFLKYLVTGNWRVGKTVPDSIGRFYWLARNTPELTGVVLLGNIVEPFCSITPDAFTRSPSWRDLLGPTGLLPDLAGHLRELFWVTGETDAFLNSNTHLQQAIKPITAIQGLILLPPNAPTLQVLCLSATPKLPAPTRRQRLARWLDRSPTLTDNQAAVLERESLHQTVAGDKQRLAGVIHEWQEPYCGRFGDIAAASVCGPEWAVLYDASSPLTLYPIQV